jgi:hypothetical protein
VTIICKKWWNPVYPRIAKGFRIKTIDKLGNLIDQTDEDKDKNGDPTNKDQLNG